MKWDWDSIKARADELIAAKPYVLQERNNYNPHALFHGWLGEWAVSEAIGIEPNFDLLPTGDGGRDFPDTQVKTSLTKHHETGKERTAKLMLSPDENKVAKYYILVALDVFEKTTELVGWTTRKKLLKADERDFGYGVRKYMETYELKPGLPPPLREMS